MGSLKVRIIDCLLKLYPLRNDLIWPFNLWYSEWQNQKWRPHSSNSPIQCSFHVTFKLCNMWKHDINCKVVDKCKAINSFSSSSSVTLYSSWVDARRGETKVGPLTSGLGDHLLRKFTCQGSSSFSFLQSFLPVLCPVAAACLHEVGNSDQYKAVL